MIRLFKHMAQMLAVTAAMLLSGCQYGSILSDLHNAEQSSDSLAICFHNGVIENPVNTRAVTLLSDHLNTMGVWGWQTTSDGLVERIFLDQEITFNPALHRWTYSPVKYWENKSTYRFHAYAPHNSTSPGVKVEIDSVKGYINIIGVTLKGCNNVSTDTITPGIFSHVDDIDWMIDRTTQNLQGKNHTDVTFNMQHILSKLCIKVKNNSTSLLQDSTMFMTLDSLHVGSFISQGNFGQKFTQAPTPDDSAQYRFETSEWTPVDTLPRYILRSHDGLPVTDSCVCIIESLLIPQPTVEGQMIDIWYTLGVKNGLASHFHYAKPLKDVFGGFVSSCNYVIEISVGPDIITFDSGMTGWENSYNTSFTKQESKQ